MFAQVLINECIYVQTLPVKKVTSHASDHWSWKLEVNCEM
jgi:hypothetical protein